jgi:hypothetical protein
MGRGSRKEKKKVKVCLDINRPSHGRTWPNVDAVFHVMREFPKKNSNSPGEQTSSDGNFRVADHSGVKAWGALTKYE